MSKAQSDSTFGSGNLNPEQKKAIIKAIDFYDTANYRSAIDLLMPIVDKTHDPVAYTCLGNCYLKAGDFYNARKYFEKAIERPTLSPFPFISFGNLYYEEGDVQKAILHWSVANTLVADDASLILNLATAYAQKDFRIQSIIYYERYLKIAAGSQSETYKKITSRVAKLKTTSAKLNGVASRYFASKSINKAIEAYRSSITNFPLQPQINLTLGNLYFMIKDYKSAVDCWLNAYITSDFSISTLGYLPLAYEKLKMFSHAYSFYYILLSGKGKKSFTGAEIKSKLLQNSVIVFRNDEASDEHFEIAKKYEAENNYLLAYVEYTNALTLCKGDKSKIEASRAKMLDFIKPELRVLSTLQVQLNSYLKNNQLAKAVETCDKILLLLPIKSSMQDEIRKKRKECKDLLALSQNS